MRVTRRRHNKKQSTLGALGLVAIIGLAPTLSVAGDELGGCFNEAGRRYGVSPELLKAIARVESDLNPRAHVKLQKSESRGIMQINSFWYPYLAEHGITPEDLWNPCTNIHVGAWVLSQEIERYGNTWTAIGAYYAGAYNEVTRSKKKEHYLVYAERVYKKLMNNN